MGKTNAVTIRVKHILTYVFFLFCSVNLYAQHTSVNFSNISVRNGMSSNWVTSLCRDSDGLMWIGTNRGLNRFDGYNLTTFELNSTDTTSLSNNFISSIAEDKDSNLWVGTNFGLNIRLHNSQSFQRISLFDYNAFQCNDVNNINNIFISQRGVVYIGTHEGFFTYSAGKFSHHLVDSTRFDAPANHVFSFTEDQNGDVWLGTFTRNLIRYSQGRPLEFIPLPTVFEGKYVSGLQKLFIDSDRLLWVGSQAGLYVYDLKQKSWNTSMNRILYQEIGNKVISGIQEDRDGTIWIATDGAGIYLFHKKDQSVLNFPFKGLDAKSISTNGLYCLLIDSSNLVWIGTYKQGLDFHNRSSKKFKLFRNEPEAENSLSSNDVDCCMEDSYGNIWIGTNGGGINILDRKTQKFRHLTVSNTGNNGLSNNVVVSLCEDHQKNIWIGTYFGGLNKYNPLTGQFTRYKHNENDTSSISDDRIWSIIENGENNLWVGTLGGGLNLFDTKTGTFKRYTFKGNSGIAGDYVVHLSLDSQKRLWACTSDGLSIYNPLKDRFDSYINKNSNTGINSFGALVSSYEDSRGWHWLCSNNGLIKFNPQTHTSVTFDTKAGLLSNSIHRILEDNLGNLWMSSSRGISKIWFTNIENDTTFVPHFMHFDETDGLQGREFSERASLKTKEGELLFGGVNGLNIFRPEEIKMDRSIPKLIFTNLRIFNTVIAPGQEFNNRIILKKPISHTDQVILKHSENLFSIEFAALTYLFPGKNKYRYRLEGFDDSWFETDGTANFATFTNLNNGDYVLHLKGSNADGTWNEEGISLKIKILPPFWKSWYALLGYIITLVFMLLALRHMILFRERLKVELRIERSEAKRLHELDMLKLKFFTNISHEFRTPLTLILSPVEKLLPRFQGLPEEKYLQHIYLNSKKLLNMINQLLDFRKMEAQGLTYHPSWGNIIEFITATVSSFNDLSENKRIELRQITGLHEFHMMFDEDKLEKILFNLLSNAFKFTPISGLVLVLVELEEVPGEGEKENKTNLVIKIKDNGNGIHPDNLDKIFTRFYQAENTKLASANGTGIGLSLIKEYVHLHGGTITVESALNIGTCFSVFLPVEQIAGLQNNELYHNHLYETKFNNEKKQDQPAFKYTSKKTRPLLLLVEDNDDLRIYLKENLEEHYEILEAEDGLQALQIIGHRMPDLILSDIMMPGMDGIELCKKVKDDKISCHIPFVFLTAKTSEQQMLEGLETGADDYIVKPFHFEILKTKIRNLIQLNLNMREVFRTKIRIEPKDISITSLDEKFMAKALDLIEEHMGDVHFSVEEFSRKIGVSRMQLYNKIMSLTGSTPLEFIRIMRLKRAAQLLNKSQLNVSEVAYQVGFNDPRYFTMQFKKEFKVLPSKYKTIEEV